MDPVRNPGGHVAHIVVKFDTPDSFEAFYQAGRAAEQIGGTVERMYSDVGASRHAIGDVLLESGVQIGFPDE